MLFLKWFASRTVRHAWQAAKHVEKILHHQRDLLSAEAVTAVQADIENVRTACRTGNKAAIKESLSKIEKSANKWLKPYPHSALRENIEVALVAIAVAMGIRTFFLQPFKIPTGSMQPTLYGVTDENLANQPGAKVPGPVAGFIDYWFNGVSYKRVVARSDGQLTAFSPPVKFILFNLKQTFVVGGQSYTVWFPPDDLLRRAGLLDDYRRLSPRNFRSGEDIINLRIISGDHLFVDRVSYNFRRPTRGDIVVFETRGIQGIADMSRELADTYYIKRLCGLGNERISLKEKYLIMDVPRMGDRPAGHLVINSNRDITASTPHFENLYSFSDAPGGTNKTLPYIENHYFGHGLIGELDTGRQFEIPPNHYFVMGDNTFNSSDSRYWGHFPQEKVIGKSAFVYWPIGGTVFKGEKRHSRFGWAHR